MSVSCLLFFNVSDDEQRGEVDAGVLVRVQFERRTS
jgi:hypothetical protein